MIDSGQLNNFLDIGLHVVLMTCFYFKKKYATNVFERAHMLNFNTIKTLVDTDSNLDANGPLSYTVVLQRELQYLTFTKLDFAYVVQQIYLFMHHP